MILTVVDSPPSFLSEWTYFFPGLFEKPNYAFYALVHYTLGLEFLERSPCAPLEFPVLKSKLNTAALLFCFPATIRFDP